MFEEMQGFGLGCQKECLEVFLGEFMDGGEPQRGDIAIVALSFNELGLFSKYLEKLLVVNFVKSVGKLFAIIIGFMPRSQPS
ncbi:hypothetical protein R9C00_21700 [Flammeovirgaceae bacterium SG7u.111]|nr:hypothetical protein [Flammeovirgaceae bacterium SG7u.132]WPO34317.1 hypothetical protein R9C00_21700 [Flammeovirgaceae bacterium SG7u.111]